MYFQRDCPACGARASALKPEVVSEPSAEGLPFSELKRCCDNVYKEKAFVSRGPKVFFPYYRCGPCGLLFCMEFFSPVQLQEVYRSAPDNSAGIALEILKKTQAKYFDAFKKYSALKGGYLEIGPDVGLFTEISLEKAAFDPYWMFEPNREVWKTLEDKLRKKTRHLHPELSELSMVPDSSMESAVMIHVLDHILEPRQALIEIHKKLKKSGILLLVTHDESSLLAKLLKKKWPPYTIFHPQLFNPRSLASLLNSTRFKVLEISKSYNYFPFMHLVKHAFQILGLSLTGLPTGSFFPVGLKLGNILTLAAPEGNTK